MDSFRREIEGGEVMLAVMKYEEELREGCRRLGVARQTRERRAQLAETRPWKT